MTENHKKASASPVLCPAASSAVSTHLSDLYICRHTKLAEDIRREVNPNPQQHRPRPSPAPQAQNTNTGPTGPCPEERTVNEPAAACGEAESTGSSPGASPRWAKGIPQCSAPTPRARNGPRAVTGHSVCRPSPLPSHCASATEPHSSRAHQPAPTHGSSQPFPPFGLSPSQSAQRSWPVWEMHRKQTKLCISS